MQYMPTPNFRLSKSTFVRGCQCEKALYLHVHHKELRDERTAQQEALFERGTTVGELAQQLFPGGVDASPENYWEYDASVALTQKLIAEGQPVIYEAAFIHDGVLAALDILVKDGEGWKGYEVKSSGSVKPPNINDAALQYHVITGAGVALQDISIVHLNTKYVRQGGLDIQKLFTIESVLDEVLELQDEVRTKIPQLRAMLTLPQVPAIAIGEHCDDPYPCDFMGHCWKDVPQPSVFDLANIRAKKAAALYHQGIVRFEDITEDIALNEGQRLQIKAHLSGKPFVDTAGIKAFLASLTYPLYYLDFETFNPAIPLYDQSRPYQRIPFQYSIHYKKSPDGELRHTEFLATASPVGSPEADPRLQFIENLLSKTWKPGLILTYNDSFEIGVLRDLARDFPSYAADIKERLTRIRDLMTPFRNRLWYHPDQQGSYSIKAVLPALVPGLSYDHLPIAGGQDASLRFEQMIYDLASDHEEIRQNLLTYCKLDTLAMVRVVEKLEQSASS